MTTLYLVSSMVGEGKALEIPNTGQGADSPQHGVMGWTSDESGYTPGVVSRH